MKIIKIFGSVEQQMFQYALYLRLRSCGDEVSLCVPQQWIASDFSLSGYVVATAEQMAEYRTSLADKVRGIFGKNADRRDVITDEFGKFSRDVIDLRHGLCVGSWASPRYFEAASQAVRDAFVLPDERLSAAARGVTSLMGDGETVAMLVRNPTSPANTCTTDYYNWALANIRTYIPDIQLLVFTDSPELVKKHLLLPDGSRMMPTANLTDIDLMQVMLRASHVICDNTLTAWWAAWLNPNPDKIVIVPQRWCADSDAQPRDLIPIYWTAIPVT